MWICAWELLTVYHYSDKFNDHNHCDSGDITFLICDLTSRDYMFKGLREFMTGSFLLSVTTLPYLVTISQVEVEIWRNLNFHVTSQNHVI